jgi:CBS domain-containing protein
VDVIAPDVVNVTDDTFVKDALDTFILAEEGIEKLIVTDRFSKLVFDGIEPPPLPVIAVPFTLSDDIETFVKDALDTFINVPVGMAKLPLDVINPDVVKVPDEIFVNDALDTFIKAVDGIEKLIVTDRF